MPAVVAPFRWYVPHEMLEYPIVETQAVHPFGHTDQSVKDKNEHVPVTVSQPA